MCTHWPPLSLIVVVLVLRKISKENTLIDCTTTQLTYQKNGLTKSEQLICICSRLFAQGILIKISLLVQDYKQQVPENSGMIQAGKASNSLLIWHHDWNRYKWCATKIFEIGWCWCSFVSIIGVKWFVVVDFNIVSSIIESFCCSKIFVWTYQMWAINLYLFQAECTRDSY